jgi:hypothetical protein
MLSEKGLDGPLETLPHVPQVSNEKQGKGEKKILFGQSFRKQQVKIIS